MKEDMEFDNQRPGEEIILVGRKHPWVLAKAALILVLLFSVVVIAFMQFGASKYSSAVLVAGLIIGLIFSMGRWFVYANDIYILTTERLININQRGVFNRRVSEVELDNIYNISYEIKGITRSLLNFGDVQISTVGDEISTITLANVENPHFIHDKIVSEQKKYKSVK